MGRWIVLEEDDFVRDNSDGWCGSCASEDDAKNIARRHKQECDHYEQRIAELKRRLGAMVEVFNEVACTPACNGECSRCTAEREMLKITKGIWDD